MKKITLLVSLVLLWAAQAWATTFTFSGVDKNGTGSAVMDIAISGNVMTLTLDNTSPTLTSTNLANIPAIVAFGWNLDNNPLPDIVGWSLAVHDENNNVVYLDGSGTAEWAILIDGKLEGIKFDFIPNNSAQSNVAAAFYNPAAQSILTDSQVHYFTQAILTITFNTEPVLSQTAGESTYVRMQRVGENAGGSLKLLGVLDDGSAGGTGGPDPVPEPGTIMLLGAGLVGLAILRKK